jgi:3-oxoacyl-[acyl-carrier protein] reductase
VSPSASVTPAAASEPRVSVLGEAQRRPEGSCALVTGAGRGIGRAIALALAEDGWPVAVNYRSSGDAAAATVAAIEAAGGRAVAIQGDVADPSVPAQLVEAVHTQLGPIAVLVNNAGLRADGLALSLTDEDWQRVLDTNLGSTYRLTRTVLREMIRARFGRIVNIASVVGPRANAGQANYAASKAAVIAFTKTAAVEVARRGVTVNAVAPGLIATDMTEDIPTALGERVPAQRPGRPEEVAAAVAFLASERASYITASTLYVDGGLSA